MRLFRSKAVEELAARDRRRVLDYYAPPKPVPLSERVDEITFRFGGRASLAFFGLGIVFLIIAFLMPRPWRVIPFLLSPPLFLTAAELRRRNGPPWW